jgi:IS30 family transposase
MSAASNRPTDPKLGHWEGDLIVGPHDRSAIGTLVERQTRYVKLLHVPGLPAVQTDVKHAGEQWGAEQSGS